MLSVFVLVTSHGETKCGLCQIVFLGFLQAKVKLAPGHPWARTKYKAKPEEVWSAVEVSMRQLHNALHT